MPKRLIARFGLLCLLLAGGMRIATHALEELADVTRLELKERATLDLLASPAGTSAFLAPDGEHFVWVGAEGSGKVICLYSTEGQRKGCAPLPRNDAPETLRWAPDSSGVVFAQDALRLLVDSDIWLFEADTLRVRNLTEDGEERVDFFSDSPQDVPIDIVPMWSADSQRVYFLRYSLLQEKRDRPELYAYDLASDTLELVHIFTLSQSFSLYVATISKQGDQMAYILDQRSGLPELRLLNLETKEDRLLQTIPPQGQMRPVIDYLAFSPDGRYLLAHDAAPLLFDMRMDPETTAVRLFDMDGTEIRVDAERFVAVAGWLPEGAALAYLTWELNPQQGALLISAEPGQPGRQVLEGRFGSPTTYQERLDWGANHTLLLTELGGRPLHVLRFGGE